MSNSYDIFIWKKAPFLRLLIPVMAGILLQFYFQTPVSTIIFFAIVLAVLLYVFSFLPQSMQFRFKPVRGILITLLLLLFGSYFVWHKNTRNDSQWYGHFTNGQTFIVATIAEPLQEKAKSFKATANADAIILNEKERKTHGRFLIYFSKDSASRNLKYGDRIIVKQSFKSNF